MDLAVKPGQTIRSPASGTVTFSGRVVDRGVITVTTDDGYLTSFEPVTEQLPRGTRVSSGDVIARRDWEQSHEGCSSCLHWGVRHGGDYVNPLLLVGALSPSVLWPLPPRPRPLIFSYNRRLLSSHSMMWICTCQELFNPLV
ncbi:M23 family metallopeptidase [Kocuria sp. TGY1127_2]|uniref:M23 family metallopeptidase n=1 Tax=Kocuria sp. TGY1127_2 TaxID=2711328 RepID=UPI002111BFB6|nr:M23 family metallopeptidase [Kocuria sp. TGY1127_2]